MKQKTNFEGNKKSARKKDFFAQKYTQGIEQTKYESGKEFLYVKIASDVLLNSQFHAC